MFPLVALAVVFIEFVVDVPDQPEGNVHVYEVAPATADIEYEFNVPEQIIVVPEIDPGVAGIVLTVIAKLAAEELPQLLFAVTVIFPLVELAVVRMLLVVEVPLHPDGNVHVYDVAPATGEILYVLEEPEQMVAVPEIVPGVAGRGLTVIANVTGAELPQPLFAVTVIFPLVEPAVVEMELVVDVPLQPDGKVHVYEVAPETAATE